MSERRALRRSLRLAIPVIVGVAGAYVLKSDFFDTATQELMALFGLVMAAVLPAMVLNATMLRPAGLSVQRIRTYQRALIRQVRLWAYLFLVSLIACFCIVVGKSIRWSIPIKIPSIESLGIPDYQTDLAFMLNFFVVAFITTVLMRAIAVIDGIMSLINLSADLAVSEAQKRDEAEKLEMLKGVKQMPPRPGYGDYVGLGPPH